PTPPWFARRGAPSCRRGVADRRRGPAAWGAGVGRRSASPGFHGLDRRPHRTPPPARGGPWTATGGMEAAVGSRRAWAAPRWAGPGGRRPRPPTADEPARAQGWGRPAPGVGDQVKTGERSISSR